MRTRLKSIALVAIGLTFLVWPLTAATPTVATPTARTRGRRSLQERLKRVGD